MQHEDVAVFAGKGVDDLCIAAGAEGGNDQCLGFATGKEGGTMHARQDTGADGNRAHGDGIAAVNARFFGKDTVTYDAVFEVVYGIADGGGIPAVFAHQGSLRGFVNGGNGSLAFLFVGDLVGRDEFVVRQFAYFGDERFVSRRRLPVPGGFARFGGQFADGVDDHLHLFVAVHDGAEHDVFRQFVRLRLNHQHRTFGAGDNEVKVGGLQFFVGRVEQVSAVFVTDARRANRAVERHAGEGNGGRGANHRRDVRTNVGIDRHDAGNDLYFVEEAFGEERAQRAVNQARDQCFVFAGTAFATEVAAGDTAGGVGFFLIIDGQRKEVLSFGDGFFGNRCHEYDSAFHIDHDGAICLAGDFAAFQGNLVFAVAKGDVFFHADCLARSLISGAGRGRR